MRCKTTKMFVGDTYNFLNDHCSKEKPHEEEEII